MANWVTFANVLQLNTPDLDTNFGILAAKVVYPCTVSGANTIALTTAAADPPVTSYTSRAPVFAFVASGNSTTSVTINVNGIGAKNLYKSNGTTQVASGDLIGGGIYYVAYDGTLNSAAGGFVLIGNPALAAVTVQSLISGSGATYTPTSGTVRIRVRMVAGGGSGGASGAGAGTGGTNNTTFQVNGTGTAWTCVGGSGGGAGGVNPGGAGGTGGANGSTGTLIARYPGQRGGDGIANAAAISSIGGQGGGTILGLGTQGAVNAAGRNGATNSGAGGSGGAATNGATGGGGGGGEGVEFWVTNITNAIYTVGASVTGGTGGNAGGNSAAGWIIVEEYPW